MRDRLLEHIPNSLVVADATAQDYPIVYVNQAFRDLTGYDIQEVIGRNPRFLSGPATSEETKAEIRAALAEQRHFAVRILNYRKDGSAFWNELTLTPMLSNDGAPFVVGMQTDVTERLELEARFLETQRMEALGKLSGGIAHDFNNVLALILGNAEIIASEGDRESVVVEAANDIIEAAEGGAGLVRRLLDYARGEEGSREDVNVNGVIADVLTLISRGSNARLRIETDLSAAVGRIRVDRALFNTSIMNLLLNAQDAVLEQGSIKVSTRLRSNAGRALGTVVVIQITDNGVGMDEETRARAFEPFFTTKGAGRGNGLGLAMVYNFAKQAGGEVTIVSAPGEGTSVTLLLPTETDEAEASDEKQNALRVLVIEDDPKVRKMMAMQVSRAGYLVDEVASAEEALALVDEGLTPTVVLSDVRLREGMSGPEFVLALRKRNFFAPVVFVTGFAEELDRYGEQLSEVPILRKPFRQVELIMEIEKAIHGAGR